MKKLFLLLFFIALSAKAQLTVTTGTITAEEGTATITGVATLDAVAVRNGAHGNFATNEEFSAATGVHTGTITGARTIALTDFTEDGGYVGGMTIWFTQNGTGGYAITWPAAVAAPTPAIRLAPNSVTKVRCDSFDAGTTIYCVSDVTPVSIIVSVSDETTAITAADNKVKMRSPFAFVVTGVRASLRSAAATGTFTVDINEGDSRTSILSTKLTIDATELTSTTATFASVISDNQIADDALLTFDVDNAGDDLATGCKVVLTGYR